MEHTGGTIRERHDYYNRVKALNLSENILRWNSRGSTTAYWRDLWERESRRPIVYAIRICMTWNSGITSNSDGREIMVHDTTYTRHIEPSYININIELISGRDIPLIEVRNRIRVAIGETNEIRMASLFYDVRKYVEDCGAKLVYLDYCAITGLNDARREWGTMQLRGTPLKLLEYCNLVDSSNDENCVKSILKSVCDKKLYNDINNMGSENGVEINELKEFAVKHAIPINILNNLCNVEWSNVKNTDENYINIMAYNNHAYFFGKRQPKKNKQPTRVMIVKNCNDKLNEIIESGKLPFNIVISNVNEKLNKVSVSSFMDDNYKYISNPEYIECHKILKLFGCEDDITDNVTINHITKIIEKKYIQDDINSIIPNINLLAQSGYVYKKENIDTKRTIITEDINKAYTDALLNLPFVTKCDWRTSTISVNVKDIVDNNMYIIEVDESNDKRGGIVLISNNVYHGYHLKKCMTYGLKFKIIEEIKTEIRPNYYNQMINDMIKYIGWDYSRTIKSCKLVEVSDNDPLDYGIEKMNLNNKSYVVTECDKVVKVLKNMINIMIGSMRMSAGYAEKYKCLGIYNNDETERHSGYCINLNNDYNIIYNVKKDITNIKNKLPIHLQIINDVNMKLFERIMNSNIKMDDILQIKTDSISYYGKPHRDYSDRVGGWKLEKFIELIYTPEHRHGKTTFNIRNEITDCRKVERVLYSVNAGNGKTTYIINNIIPNLLKNNKKFIVLAPTHTALQEYIKLGYNCDVITAYAYGNKSIGDVDYVIIDEIGLVGGDGCNFLYKLSMTTMNYICVGDWNQLNPVSGKQINTKHYNEFMYNTFEVPKELKVNHRNNFSDEYYEKLKKEKYDNLAEIKKYSTENYYDAEYIICYRNDTVNMYNEKMLKYKNKKPTDIGVPYLCKTNEIDGLSNNNIVVIKDNTDGVITLSNGIKIKEKQILTKKFKLAYAVTIYSLQGAGINSYYWASEDDVLFNNGIWDTENMNKITYTIISRLKGEVSK